MILFCGLELVMNILASVWRWSLPGKVCSGEYSRVPIQTGATTDDGAAYAISAGSAVKALTIVYYSALGLYCCLFVGMVCFFTCLAGLASSMSGH